jgi:hypothetical protein
MDWIHMAQNKDQCPAFLITVMALQVLWKESEF